MRNALSILDQGISLSRYSDAKILTETLVYTMLGLGNRQKVSNLFISILEGEIEQSLQLLRELNQDGIDPLLLTQDLLQIVYTFICCKVTPNLTPPHSLNNESIEIAKRLPLSVFLKVWSCLFKGYQEISASSIPFQTLEMVIIQLMFARNLPPIEEILKNISQGGLISNSSSSQRTLPKNFEDCLKELLIHQPLLATHAQRWVRLISYQPGEISFETTVDTPAEFTKEFKSALEKIYAYPWVFNICSSGGGKTLWDQKQDLQDQRYQSLMVDPIVDALLKAFPHTQVYHPPST